MPYIMELLGTAPRPHTSPAPMRGSEAGVRRPMLWACGAAAEVVEQRVRRCRRPDADLAALGVEEALVSRVQRDGRDQRAVLVDLDRAVGLGARPQHIAIGEGRGFASVECPDAVLAQPQRR